MKPVRMVMKMCVPSSSKIMIGPHTKPSTASMTSSGLVAVAIPSASPVNGVMKNDVRKSSMAFPFPYREERMRSGEPKGEESPQRILFPRVYDRENATEGSLQNCFDLENERVAALIACYTAGKERKGKGARVRRL